MRQSLVPALLLATVALSSSNVLPIISINQLETDPVGLNTPENDNIFSNSIQNSNSLNDVFYKVSIGKPLNDRYPKVRKLPDLEFVNLDNNRDDDLNLISKDASYNGEGFRKEQWHNYPRQLDRLHKYLYEHHNTDKRNPDPDNPEIADANTDDNDVVPNFLNRINDLTTNEFLMYSNDAQNVYDTVIANTNPFLILKIRLACLGNKLENTDMEKNMNLASYEIESNVDEKENDKTFTNEINPSIDAVKVKRENISGSQNKESAEDPANGKTTVKKRLFSLWSRLQSLNHKGHELQHRRHLHTFYGLNDGDGNGVLTAETRATMMRPPGSPLRWG